MGRTRGKQACDQILRRNSGASCEKRWNVLGSGGTRAASGFRLSCSTASERSREFALLIFSRTRERFMEAVMLLDILVVKMDVFVFPHNFNLLTTSEE